MVPSLFRKKKKKASLLIIRFRPILVLKVKLAFLVSFCRSILFI